MILISSAACFKSTAEELPLLRDLGETFVVDCARETNFCNGKRVFLEARRPLQFGCTHTVTTPLTLEALYLTESSFFHGFVVIERTKKEFLHLTGNEFQINYKNACFSQKQVLKMFVSLQISKAVHKSEATSSLWCLVSNVNKKKTAGILNFCFEIHISESLS